MPSSQTAQHARRQSTALLALATALLLTLGGAPTTTAATPPAGSGPQAHATPGTPPAGSHATPGTPAGGSDPAAHATFGAPRATLATRTPTLGQLLARDRRALRRCLRRHPHHPRRCAAARRAERRVASRLVHVRRLWQIKRSTHASSPRPTMPAGAHASVSAPEGASVGSSASAASAPSGFEMGAVVGSAELYELPWLEQLGAHTARMEFDIGTPASQLAPVVEAYAKAGIRPLLLATFTARTPTSAEAQNLATWAAAYGPGGTFWRGKSMPAGTAVSDIEFGNETNNPYQYGSSSETWWEEPAFIARAEAYARRLQEAAAAIAQTGVPVGLLGIADEYGGHTTWVQAMFRAVPNLAEYVAGWTIHPYGPIWKTSIDNMLANLQAHGAPSSIPFYVTEWGLSSDNGRCLSDNFGWNRCMTYQEAAEVLTSTVAAMRSRYGSRMRALYVFQARDQQPTGSSSSREVYFGALQSNRAPKGAYTTAVQSLLAANP